MLDFELATLHANTSINSLQRDGLYKLIEYIAHGPISNKRIQITEAGLVKLELKTSWSNGTTHLLFTKAEFLEKLAAFIPPPRTHLVRWSGVFSSNSPMRRKIVLKPEIKKGFQFRDEQDPSSDKPRPQNPSNLEKAKFLALQAICHVAVNSPEDTHAAWKAELAVRLLDVPSRGLVTYGKGFSECYALLGDSFVPWAVELMPQNPTHHALRLI